MFSRRDFSRAGAGLIAAALTVRAGSTLADEQKTEKFAIMKTEEEWRKTLTPEQFHVLRKHGTERAGTSPLDKNYSPGTYLCAGCDQPVYSSETKFDSGTGWPSFWQPIENATGSSTDYYLIYPRTEIHCSRCGGHLGHVFDDGPKPTGKRYCMNGVAMKFVPKAGS